MHNKPNYSVYSNLSSLGISQSSKNTIFTRRRVRAFCSAACVEPLWRGLRSPLGEKNASLTALSLRCAK